MKRKIIVLMPVKNEAWILPLSLQAASVWADMIILSDQGSTDGSKEIARRFPKVHLIENDSLGEFNEYKMREPLISTARKLTGIGNVLISLDADELLTPYFNSIDYKRFQELPEGTVLQFFLANITPNFEKYWTVDGNDFGYIDDGKPFQTGLIHVPRLFTPNESNNNIYKCQDLGVLHYQYVYWDRMESKHRWYQCYERIHIPEKSVIDIYRRYHHMYNPNLNLKPFPTKWIELYKEQEVDITAYKRENVFWWDQKVVQYFKEFGTAYFSQIDIWKHDWTKLSKDIKYSGKITDKLLLLYLRKTRELFYRKGFRKIIRLTDSLLKKVI